MLEVLAGSRCDLVLNRLTAVIKRQPRKSRKNEETEKAVVSSQWAVGNVFAIRLTLILNSFAECIAYCRARL